MDLDVLVLLPLRVNLGDLVRLLRGEEYFMCCYPLSPPTEKASVPLREYDDNVIISGV